MHIEAVRAQISIGIETYKDHFGRYPRGIWLPECGYVLEIEDNLSENGIEYILMEAHGIIFADPRPIYGTFSLIVSPKGVMLSDAILSLQCKYGVLTLATQETMIIGIFIEISVSIWILTI